MFIVLQLKMIKNDQNERDRIDIRNVLEEYIYDVRDKFSDGPWSKYIPGGGAQILSQAMALEEWLYEDGSDCSKQEYETKLNELRALAGPAQLRSHERETQPSEFNDLGHTVQMALKAVTEYRAGAVKYDHLTETEILNLSEAAERAQKWHDEQMGQFAKTPLTDDLPIKSTDIRLQQQTLAACMNSVLNRPKPKPPTPPAASATPADKTAETKEEQPSTGEPTVNDPMDVE